MGMSNIPSSWGDDGPEPLVQLCTRNVAQNPDCFCDRYMDDGSWTLKSDIILPQEICEKLIHVWQEIGPEKLDDEFLSMFQDLHATRLKRIVLRNSNISDNGLKKILPHKLTDLDISKCKKLTTESIQNINMFGSDLISLTLFKNPFKYILQLTSGSPGEIHEPKDGLNTPNLRRLILKNVTIPGPIKEKDFFSRLIQPLSKLNYLDLSGCHLIDLSCLQNLSNLTTLLLHEVSNIQKAISSLYKLKTLRFLDISQVHLTHGIYTSPDTTLEEIAKYLPCLTHLDISGTNLAGDGHSSQKSKDSTDDDKDTINDPLCDIPGLQSRVKRPLEFLGLYNTFNDACHRYCIPAITIAGDANEAQILAAAEAYLDRPTILVKALNELFRIFRYETCNESTKAFNLILYAMMRHRTEKNIQVSGSASLFYIAKNEEKSKLSMFARRKMISILLDAMERHIDDVTMMRNGCLTICQFRIPQDVGFGYRRLVVLLLKLLRVHMDNDDLVRRIAMYLLNSLACQVDGHQKELVGDLGAIETMLGIIRDRLTNGLHDDVLEIAWSAMWNVTDETPVNCQRFLDKDGMNCFQKCLTEFPEKEELLRNMMGLLGNVAEVAYLRPRLVRSDLIETFAKLLDSTSDGIEVSYNAAGVLSHIASDGKEAWSIQTPTRQYVLDKMVSAIERWDLTSRRNINYRSFEPILRLLQQYSTPECQLWAVWALANLTKVHPEKYCPLVEKEGGLQLLEELLDSTIAVTMPRAISLANTVIKQCKQYKITLEGGALEIDSD